MFKTNSRIAQEWGCDSLSRLEEKHLWFAELRIVPFNNGLQLIVLFVVLQTDNPGKILPAPHPGSPSERTGKSDTEDALAIVNRKGRPHLFITVTMNANWPEITSNLIPGQTAYD